MADDAFREKLNAILEDPEALSRVVSLASGLAGGAKGEASHADREEKDREIGKDSHGHGHPSDNLFRKDSFALLAAIRPFLSPARAEKLDKLLKIGRVLSLAEKALQ